MWKYIINLMIEHNNLFPMINFAYEHEAIQHFMSIYTSFDMNNKMTIDPMFYTPLTPNNNKIPFLADGLFYNYTLSAKQGLIENCIPIQYKFKFLNSPMTYDHFNNFLYDTFSKYHKTSTIIEVGVNNIDKIEDGRWFLNFNHNTIKITDYNYLNGHVTEEFKIKANSLIEYLKSSKDLIGEQSKINSLYHQDFYKINVDPNLPMSQEIKNWKNNF